MTINEALIDKRIAQAAHWYSDSDTTLKYAAIAAGRVVGLYDGVTAEIARQTRRSVSSVENWAHAYRLYRELRSGAPTEYIFCHSRVLWRELPISHWWQASDAIDHTGDCYKYLYLAHQHGWSGRRMLAEYRADYEAQHGAPPPLSFERKWQKAKAVITDLLASFDELSKLLTCEQMEALRVFVEAFGTNDQ